MEDGNEEVTNEKLENETAILAFFQFPDATVAEMKITARQLGVIWIVYLNQFYREFVFSCENK